MKKYLLLLILIFSVSFIIGDAQNPKHWVNTWTEIEELGNGKFGATIHTGHRVFFDKTDNQYKKHKLTDERPAKDYVLVQSAKCCVEVYPHYAKYFDVDHEEVRLYEERWIVQRWRDPPGKWQDIGAWDPIISTEENDSGITVTIDYTTDYGQLTVKYIQRDGIALKHDVIFNNTSGSTETFRVLQRWAGIVGSKCNGKDIPVIEDVPFLAFHDSDKTKKKFNIAENLYSMVFNADGSEKTDQYLQRPIIVETHANGMKTDFIYGDWILAQNENLEIDPVTYTNSNPTEDGYVWQDSPGVWARMETLGVFVWGGTPTGLGPIARAYVEWNISGIPEGATVTNTIFKYHGNAHESDSHIREMLGCQPSEQPDNDTGNHAIWSEAGAGTVYADPAGFPVVATNQQVDLGASADSDLQSQLTANWFAIGLRADSESIEASNIIYAEESGTANPKPTLYVVYTPLPDPPTNVQATDGAYTDRVRITWAKSDYATDYQVYRNATPLGWLGDVATYDDTGADAPTVIPGTASASDGTSINYVTLSIAGESVSNGTTHTYKVKAKNAAGESGYSETDTGYRGHGTLTYQWQRSAADLDEDYSNIDGATTDPYNDTGAPEDGSGRYYRCVENATGATEQTTNADRGYRIPLAEVNVIFFSTPY